MAVETEISQVTFSTIVDGIPVTCPFPVENVDHLKVVYLNDLVATRGVHYNVTLAPPDYDSATVTPLVGFAELSQGTINVSREPPYLQTLVIPTLATLASARLEQALDYVTFLAQMLRDLFARALTFPRTDPLNSRGPLPAAALRALKFLAFDVTGKPIAAVATMCADAPVTSFGLAWVSLADTAAALISLGFTTVGAFGKQLVATASVEAARVLLDIPDSATITSYSVPVGASLPFDLSVDYLPDNYLFLNGQTIGNGASAGTARANEDVRAYWLALYSSQADAQAPVSGGRGASADIDFDAGKTIALPDKRGRVHAGTNTMGTATANRLTTAGSAVNGDVLGTTGGVQNVTLDTTMIPAHHHAITWPGGAKIGQQAGLGGVGGGVLLSEKADPTAVTDDSTGGGAAHVNVQPVYVGNWIVRFK